jgi:hypothetical protein
MNPLVCQEERSANYCACFSCGGFTDATGAFQSVWTDTCKQLENINSFLLRKMMQNKPKCVASLNHSGLRRNPPITAPERDFAGEG